MSGPMLEEEADVLRVEGEIAWIDAQRRTTCNSCSAQAGCGTGVLAKVLGQRKTEMRAINRVGARPGQRVVVGVTGLALVKSSLAVYAVPLLLFFVMAGFGQVFAANLHAHNVETWTILSAFLGLLLGFLWVGRFSVLIRHNPHYQPIILRILPEGGAAPLHFAPKD